MRTPVTWAACLLFAACSKPSSPAEYAADAAPAASSAPSAPSATGSLVLLSSAEVAGPEQPQLGPNGDLFFVSAAGVVRVDRQQRESLLLPAPPRSVARPFSERSGDLLLVRWRRLVGGADAWLINLASGSVRAVEGRDGSLTAASADGTVFGVRTPSGQTQLYDLQNNTEVSLPLANGPGFGLSHDGRYVRSGPHVYDHEGQLRWTLPGKDSTHGTLLRHDGRDLFLHAGDKKLTLVELESLATHVADGDCGSGGRKAIGADGAGPVDELLDHATFTFARQCAGGALLLDLGKLLAHTGTKPLNPMRVKGTLSSPLRDGKLTVYDTSGATEVDLRSGEQRPANNTAERLIAQAGAARIVKRERTCRVEGASAVPASDALCNGKLSADGTTLLVSTPHELALYELPAGTRRYRYFPAGYDTPRQDAVARPTIEVDGQELFVELSTHSFRVPNQLPNNERYQPLAAPLSGEHEQRLQAALQGVSANCQAVGHVDGQQLLVRCRPTPELAAEFHRLDAQNFTLVRTQPAVLRSGAVQLDPKGRGTLGGYAVASVTASPTPRHLLLVDAQSQEPKLAMLVGDGFAIATDGAQLQVFGERARAAGAVRCLAEDHTLLPMDRCPAQEATLF